MTCTSKLEIVRPAGSYYHARDKNVGSDAKRKQTIQESQRRGELPPVIRRKTRASSAEVLQPQAANFRQDGGTYPVIFASSCSCVFFFSLSVPHTLASTRQGVTGAQRSAQEKRRNVLRRYNERREGSHGNVS